MPPRTLPLARGHARSISPAALLSRARRKRRGPERRSRGPRHLPQLVTECRRGRLRAEAPQRVTAHEPRPALRVAALRPADADAAAVGSAVVRIAIVVRIVDARLSLGTGNAGDSAAERRLVDAHSSAISAAVVRIAVVARIVDAGLPLWARKARYSAAERGLSLAFTAMLDADSGRGGRARIAIRHAVAAANGLVFLGARLRAIDAASYGARARTALDLALTVPFFHTPRSGQRTPARRSCPSSRLLHADIVTSPRCIPQRRRSRDNQVIHPT